MPIEKVLGRSVSPTNRSRGKPDRRRAPDGGSGVHADQYTAEVYCFAGNRLHQG